MGYSARDPSSGLETRARPALDLRRLERWAMESELKQVETFKLTITLRIIVFYTLLTSSPLHPLAPRQKCPAHYCPSPIFLFLHPSAASPLALEGLPKLDIPPASWTHCAPSDRLWAPAVHGPIHKAGIGSTSCRLLMNQTPRPEEVFTNPPCLGRCCESTIYMFFLGRKCFKRPPRRTAPRTAPTASHSSLSFCS